jgi:hypothetical protein
LTESKVERDDRSARREAVNAKSVAPREQSDVAAAATDQNSDVIARKKRSSTPPPTLERKA